MAGQSHAEQFAAALGARGRAPLASAELEARLEALIAAGRGAWPSLPLPDQDFVRELALRLEPDDEPLLALAQVRAGDLWLTLACARGDERAMRLLDERFLSRVPALVHRLDSSGALGAETLQILREKLLVRGGGGPRIADYSGRGDLLGWLRVVALRTALKERRRQEQKTPPFTSSESAEQLQAGADPERDYLRVRYRGDYEAAFRAALEALGSAGRLLLKLHYVDALSLPRLAALFQVHRATVARRLADARRTLLETTRAKLQERVKLTDSEFDSVLQLVRSQLGAGVRSALGKKRLCFLIDERQWPPVGTALPTGPARGRLLTGLASGTERAQLRLGLVCEERGVGTGGLVGRGGGGADRGGWLQRRGTGRRRREHAARQRRWQ